MSASSTLDSDDVLASSVSCSRESADSRRWERAPFAARSPEDVIEVGVELVEVAAQRGAVACLQVIDRVTQNVEQLAVAGRLAVAEARRARRC